MKTPLSLSLLFSLSTLAQVPVENAGPEISLKVGTQFGLDAARPTTGPATPAKTLSTQSILYKSYPQIKFALTGHDAEKPNYNYWPVIFVQASAKNSNAKPEWRAIELAAFKSFEWLYIASDFTNKTFFALLEYTVEGPAASLPLLSSQDGGQSWRYVGQVPKPSYQATLIDFQVDARGRGFATFTQDDPKKPQLNYYRVSTQNFGKSWKTSKAPSSTSVLERGSIEGDLSSCLGELRSNPGKLSQKCRIELPAPGGA